MGWPMVRDRYRVKVNPLLTERRIELAILLLFLLLILQLVYGASRLALLSTPKVVSPAADSLQVSEILSQQRITMEQRNEIRDRPLLWAARRPFVAPVSVPVVKAPEPKPFKGFQLVGLFGHGESAGVIVSLKGKTQRMRPGETLGEWKLKSVGANDAVFTSGSQEETLVLKVAPIAPPDRGEKK
jgi:hypothetical protein